MISSNQDDVQLEEETKEAESDPQTTSAVQQEKEPASKAGLNSLDQLVASQPTTSVPQVNPGNKTSAQGSVNPIELFLKRDNIYPKCVDIEIQDSLEEFYQIRKHFLIFSEAGKPVYTRYGDEMTLAPFFATMSAVMPKI